MPEVVRRNVPLNTTAANEKKWSRRGDSNP
jgi:hypothetical protein